MLKEGGTMKKLQGNIPQLVAYEQAWLHFINTGEADTEIIRPVIAESWKRCRAQGLNPLTCKTSIILSEEELQKRIKTRQHLVHTAWPFMKVLYDIVKGSGFRVDLIDEEGYILKILGDDEALEICHKTNSIPGAKRSEEIAGTNSMSLCLITKNPIQIVGAEHYFHASQGWTCSAAPIFNDKGTLLGVLNMGGRYELVHKHTLGMVVATAKAIENKMKVQQSTQQLARRNSQLKTTLESISDGLIYIDKNKKITQINVVAEEILNLKSGEIVGKPVDEIFSITPSLNNVLESGQGYLNRELIINTKKKSFHCVVSAKRILRGGNVDGLVVILKRSEEVRKLVHKMVGATARFTFDNIIGKTEKMKKVIELACLAAGTSSRVIIEGASGTGKEMFAQAIHNESLHQNGPFIAVNCGAIPRELIESELFGYEEGTFTGARKGGMPGKFELAEGGTLFLDEIGDMPLEMQVKILRVLQENQVIRIGGRKAISIDVRVIAATNKNLEEEIKEGNFREDLYYRLNVIKLTVPPLRERRNDIPLIAQYILETLSKRIGKEVKGIDAMALEALQQYSWPGNIRQLENIIERAIVVSAGSAITVHDLPESILESRNQRSKDEHKDEYQMQEGEENGLVIEGSLEDIEKQAIINTLHAVDGNISKAAKILKIGRNTFYRKLEKYQCKELLSKEQ